MKSGLKDNYRRGTADGRVGRCTPCRDEKRTERSGGNSRPRPGGIVALHAAMKSGLKVSLPQSRNPLSRSCTPCRDEKRTESKKYIARQIQSDIEKECSRIWYQEETWDDVDAHTNLLLHGAKHLEEVAKALKIIHEALENLFTNLSNKE